MDSEDRYMGYWEGSFMDFPPMKTLLKQVEGRYFRMKKEHDGLKEENKRLKSDHYKDEELQKLQHEIEKKERELTLGFPITDNDWKAIKEWIDRTNPKDYYFEFHPTSVGTFGKVIDAEDENNFLEFQIP